MTIVPLNFEFIYFSSRFPFFWIFGGFSWENSCFTFGSDFGADFWVKSVLRLGRRYSNHQFIESLHGHLDSLICFFQNPLFLGCLILSEFDLNLERWVWYLVEMDAGLSREVWYLVEMDAGLSREAMSKISAWLDLI
jgi:hypothetical protein